MKVEEDKHGGWTRAADGTKGDCDGKREGWMLTPPTAGELTALTKDGLPAAKSRLGSGRGALPQPTAAEVAADEERRRAARAARGPKGARRDVPGQEVYGARPKAGEVDARRHGRAAAHGRQGRARRHREGHGLAPRPRAPSSTLEKASTMAAPCRSGRVELRRRPRRFVPACPPWTKEPCFRRSSPSLSPATKPDAAIVAHQTSSPILT